jgi:hypothetical protein
MSCCGVGDGWCFSCGNGKFAWIMDPDGNKIELWEPKLWEPS